MKKFIIALTALMLFTACNNTSNQNGNVDQSTQAIEDNTAEASPSNQGQGNWSKQSTIMSSKPMVVDFFATWCGPCKELAPILEEIEQRHKGDVIFKRIDIDQESDLAQEFNIQAVPTLMFIAPNGDYQSMVGLQSPIDIEAKIAELLNHSTK